MKNELTPWYVRNEMANRARIAWLTYGRAVREGVDIGAARTALLTVMRACEEGVRTDDNGD